MPVRAEPVAPEKLRQKIHHALARRALTELQTALREERGWVKVHAAEALLSLGYIQEVGAAFLAELDGNGQQPEHRIGIWRVLAKSLVDVVRRQNYVQQIVAAYLDPGGPDRLAAIEALVKLSYVVPAHERSKFDSLETVPTDPIEVFRCGVLANSAETNDLERLTKLLRNENVLTRALAAYSIQHLQKPPSDDVVAELIEAAICEPLSSLRVYLTSTAYVIAKDKNIVRQLKLMLLPLLSSSSKDEKYQAMAALAAKGEEDDLPILECFLDEFEADLRIASANAILHIMQR